MSLDQFCTSTKNFQPGPCTPIHFLVLISSCCVILLSIILLHSQRNRRKSTTALGANSIIRQAPINASLFSTQRHQKAQLIDHISSLKHTYIID